MFHAAHSLLLAAHFLLLPVQFLHLIWHWFWLASVN